MTFVQASKHASSKNSAAYFPRSRLDDQHCYALPSRTVNPQPVTRREKGTVCVWGGGGGGARAREFVCVSEGVEGDHFQPLTGIAFSPLFPFPAKKKRLFNLFCYLALKSSATLLYNRESFFPFLNYGCIPFSLHIRPTSTIVAIR